MFKDPDQVGGRRGVVERIRLVIVVAIEAAGLGRRGVAVRATSWRQVMHRRPVDNVDSRVRSQTYG